MRFKARLRKLEQQLPDGEPGPVDLKEHLGETQGVGGAGMPGVGWRGWDDEVEAWQENPAQYGYDAAFAMAIEAAQRKQWRRARRISGSFS